MKNEKVTVDFRPIAIHWFTYVYGINIVKCESAEVLIGRFEEWVALHNATVIRAPTHGFLLIDSIVFDTEKDYVMFKLKYGC